MRVVNRRFLLRKRVLIPLGSGVVLMLLAWFVLLPWVVRWRVDAVLDQLKLRDATYRVTRATPWTSTVRDIDAGDGNRIDELRVTYSIEGLWNRRVDNIRVKGLHLTADVREGGATIKPLEAMIREAPAASQPAAPVLPDATTATARDWPFRSVRVEDSELLIRTPQRSIALPFKATLRWPQLHAEVAGVKIDGSIGDPRETAVRFSGDGVAGADLTAVLRTLVPEAPISIPGQIALSGTFSRRGTKTTFDADVVASGATDGAADPATKIAGTNVAVEQGVFHVAGTFEGESHSLKVTAKDVALAESSVGAKASGVSAEVVFDNQSAAATTRPTQVVRMEKLSASKFDLTDAVIRFDLAPGGTFAVQEARANFLGGAVSASNVKLAPEQPIAVTLRAENVELRELLKLLANGKATGEGKVSGRLPLIFANGEVQLGEGAAEASAGGILSVTDEDTLKSVAGSAAAEAKGVTQAPQAQVRNNIVAALKDFQYESLTARLSNEPQDGLVAYVRMQGKGRTGAKQALDYDLRVTGLNDLLRSAIGLHRTVTREAAKL
jgi:hypothetical protein